ncbi:MAG TPA: acetolactate synthase small subunit [Candidatus Sumerlaeota bacterium]|nr:acetolactate synthase small subunit [Candidatus Sumerlaeota bacterium]
MRHIITALVENHFGVLARVSGLFSARGFNIDSLAVGETHDPSISRMTIVAAGDDRIIEQVIKQLNKLIDVIKVIDITEESHMERELMMLKVSHSKTNRAEIVQLVEIFKARIVDFGSKAMTIEIVGNAEKIIAFMEIMRPFGIKETARTGRIALTRG